MKAMILLIISVLLDCVCTSHAVLEWEFGNGGIMGNEGLDQEAGRVHAEIFTLIVVDGGWIDLYRH